MRRVVVCWKGPGQLLIKGEAFSRAKGDEDHLTEFEAKRLKLTGQVAIIGYLEEVTARRTVVQARRELTR